MHKSPSYYSQFARACDSLLVVHPLGTNEFIHIPGNESSLPQIIRDLHPEQIRISSNRVHLMIGVGRGGFGIAWEPQDQTHWSIKTYAESLEKVAYVETR